MATLLGSLLISLGLESGSFKSGLTAAEKEFKAATRRFEATGKSMSDLGQKMSLAVTAPLVALGVQSVRAAMESQDAIAQVNSALKSMGDSAGRTSEQLQGLAGGLMKQSLFDDDEILRKVTANLLTFGNVAGAQFDRAQAAAVDLAARLGTDLQSATLMVGKALNDPAKGIAALSRAGIQFTAQQQDQIKAMVAAGDAAGAQKIMLGELEKQFGGAAKAARDANPLAVMQQSWAEFQEKIGGELLKVLPAVTSAITSVLEAFNTLSPGMQKAVIIGGGLAAAFGPILVVLGSVVTAIAPFIAGLSAAFAAGGVVGLAQGALAGLAAAFGPILAPLAAMAAAGYLIYQNWDKIAPVVMEFWGAIQAALGPPLQDMVTTVTSTLTELWNGPLGEALRGTIGLIGELIVWQAKAFGPVFIAMLKGALDVVGNVLGLIGDALKAVSRLLEGDWSGAWEAAKSMAIHAGQAINTMFAGLPAYVLGVMQRLVTGIGEWVSNRLAAIWQGALDKIEAVKKAFFGLYDAVVGHSYVPDMVDGIAAQMLRLDGVMVDKADAATTKTKAVFQQLAADLSPIMDRLFPEAAAINAYNSDLAKINAGENAGAITPDQAAETRKRLALENRPTDSAIGQIMAGPIDTSKIEEAQAKFMQAANDNANDTEAANVRIVKSFKDTATETIGALQNMASAIKGGGFLDILSSVVNFGLQLGSIGAFGKKIQTNINTAPKFAIGTNFAPGGTALVGERGPELVDLPRGSRVTPNSQIGGNTNVQVIPSPYFDVVVNGHIQRAAPAIVSASVSEMGDRMAKVRARSL